MWLNIYTYCNYNTHEIKDKKGVTDFPLKRRFSLKRDVCDRGSVVSAFDKAQQVNFTDSETYSKC
jgi:hypothetical protein